MYVHGNISGSFDGGHEELGNRQHKKELLNAIGFRLSSLSPLLFFLHNKVKLFSSYNFVQS